MIFLKTFKKFKTVLFTILGVISAYIFMTISLLQFSIQQPKDIMIFAVMSIVMVVLFNALKRRGIFSFLFAMLVVYTTKVIDVNSFAITQWSAEMRMDFLNDTAIGTVIVYFTLFVNSIIQYKINNKKI